MDGGRLGVAVLDGRERVGIRVATAGLVGGTGVEVGVRTKNGVGELTPF